MPSYNEIWYAARTTQIVYMPRKLLETFGETRVTYNVVSSMEDDDGHVRLRTGLVKSARPLVLTPHYFRQQMLENFGQMLAAYVKENGTLHEMKDLPEGPDLPDTGKPDHSGAVRQQRQGPDREEVLQGRLHRLRPVREAMRVWRH